MRHWMTPLALSVALAGCGDDDVTTLYHEFEAVAVEEGGELSWWCQSWTLDNDEPLYVHEVRSTNDGHWHHSNWFFVPEDMYPGDDGTWPCDERGFEEVDAGIAGGVLFAQSTQSTEDRQAFDTGMAYEIPPRSKIVGNIHLLNLSNEPIESAIRFEIDTLPEASVRTPLKPMAFFHRAIELQERSVSAQTMDCDFGAPMDFNVHYVLPHYHDLGLGIRIERVGGELDGEPLFASNPVVGEPWGETLIPPAPMAGASRLRFTCTFDNPRDEEVGWGIGDQEMCVFLSYTDSEHTHGGFADGGNEIVGEEEGVVMNEAPCALAVF